MVIARRGGHFEEKAIVAKILAFYNTPISLADFDAYYESVHIPLAKKIPGLKSLATSTGPVLTPAGPSPYHLVVTLNFDSMGALEAAIASDEGKAAMADVAKFATGGASFLIFDEKPA